MVDRMTDRMEMRAARRGAADAVADRRDITKPDRPVGRRWRADTGRTRLQCRGWLLRHPAWRSAAQRRTTAAISSGRSFFHDRRMAGVDRRNLCGVHVHRDHLMPVAGQTGGGHHPDISDSETAIRAILGHSAANPFAATATKTRYSSPVFCGSAASGSACGKSVGAGSRTNYLQFLGNLSDFPTYLSEVS